MIDVAFLAINITVSLLSHLYMTKVKYVAWVFGQGFHIAAPRRRDFCRRMVFTSNSSPPPPREIASIVRKSNPAFVGFQPREINLGDQLWGSRIPVDLTFVNRGPRSVAIASIDASCSCTVIKTDRYIGEAVAPDDELTIEAMFDIETNPGRKTSSIRLTGDDGQKYSATILANVLGTWSVTPGTVDLGRVVLDDPEATASQITVYESLEDELVGVDAGAAGWIETRLAPRGDGRTEILMRVKRERLPPGISSASIVVKTTNPIKPASVIYVRAKGVYSLVAAPAYVSLIGTESKLVVFKNEDGTPADLREYSVEDSNLEIELLAEGKLRITNPSGQLKNELVTVIVTDQRGREREIIVSTF